MNQTTNYHLSQYDPTDRIQMENFNADNLKLEQALAVLAENSTFVKLKEITTTEDTAQIDIDLSDLDMTQFRELELDIRLGSDGGNPDNYANTIRLYWNNETQYFGNISYTGFQSGSVALLRARFYLGQTMAVIVDKAYQTIGEFITSFNTSGGVTQVDLPGIQTLRLSGWYGGYTSYTNPLPAGTRVTLCGIK